MKMLCILLIISNSLYPMMRSRPSAPVRPYSKQRTISIKVTNPKLIASLEAARCKAQPETPQTLAPTRKAPEFIANFYLPHVPLPQTSSYSRAADRTHCIRSSSSIPDIPLNYQTRPEIVADAALCVAEGYLEYKTYQTVDKILFDHPLEHASDDLDED